MRDPVEVVDEQIRAYVAGDIDAFAATYEEDALCAYWPAGEIRARNRAEIHAVWGAQFERSSRTFRLAGRIVMDRFVIDHEDVTFTPPGQRVEAIAVYLVGPERIARVWFLRTPDFPLVAGLISGVAPSGAPQ